MLLEITRLITDRSTLANLFKNYLINITSTLKFKTFLRKFKSITNLLILYKDHISIQKIRETYKIEEKFDFKKVSSNEVKEKARKNQPSGLVSK